MESREMTTFYQEILQHLIAYKKKRLGITDSGHYVAVSKKTGKVVDYGEREWILPDEDKLTNYMCKEAIEVSKNIKLHEHWYHLNSSQTLCINYFAPLISNNYEKLNIVLTCLLNFDIKIVSHAFEYVETKGSTNFDFYCVDSLGHKYYFEIKYTEKDVAKTTGSKDPHDVFLRLYKPLILKNSYLKKCLVGENWKEFMFNHYQAYRNIVMANEEKGNYTFFITMSDNEGTNEELKESFGDSDDILKNVKWIYWEELLTFTDQLFMDDEKTYNYYKEMEYKYLVIND